MNRRNFIAGAAGAVLGTEGRFQPAGPATAGRRPNLLLIMADQFRPDCLGADGNRMIRTPNLDRLAARGIRFRRAYSATPTCTPARAALLTGLSPWNHGMLGYGKIAESYPIEMPRLLAKAGYYTAMIGKGHYSPQRSLHGFHFGLLDEASRVESVDFRNDYRCWFYSMAPNRDPEETGLGSNDYRAAPYALPEQLHPTHWTGQTAAEFLKTYTRPEPFFLKVSFNRPHSPYDPPERWWKRYEDADLPQAQVGAWAGRYAACDPTDYNLWHGDLGERQVRKSRQGYYGSISHVDEQIGRILEALDHRGWTEQTLIVFTADHGDMTGDHHLWRKSYAYESSARIPMLVAWPESLVEAQRGQVSSRPVELRDVLPTLLDAAGATSPLPMDGRSLLALARGREEGWREWIDLEHDICYSPENHWNALTDGTWKYIYHARDGVEQLFHLDRDPWEKEDLAGSEAHSAPLRNWRERLIRHLAPRGEEFVAGGRLALRPGSRLYSPHYPKKTV